MPGTTHARACLHPAVPVLTVAAVLAADQLTKQAILRALPTIGHQLVVVRGFFSLVHYRNPGAAWGILPGATDLLSFVSILVIAGVTAWFDRLTEGIRVRAISLSLIVGGVAGNLIDRMLYREVIDFLLVYYRTFQWPAFNVADSAITCGVMLYIVSTFLSPRHAS